MRISNYFDMNIVLLTSFLNTKLRDFYPSLEVLCDDLQMDYQQLSTHLETHGLRYNPTNNRIEEK